MRRRGFELILTAVEQITKGGGGEHLGRNVQARRDGGELLLLSGQEFDRKAHD